MMNHSWKIGGKKVNISHVDRFYRENVLGITRGQLAAVTGCDVDMIERHEERIYNENTHTAYFKIPGYNLWLNSMTHDYQKQVAGYCGYISAADDVTQMSSEEFDRFADSVIAMVG